MEHLIKVGVLRTETCKKRDLAGYQALVYGYTVSNKNTYPSCTHGVYLRNHLSYKKSYFHLFASLSEELSDEKTFF